MHTGKLRIKYTIAMFALLNVAQAGFSGAGTYVTPSGKVYGLSYSGDEYWTAVTVDDSGALVTQDIADDELTAYTDNVLGPDAQQISDEWGSKIGTSSLDLTSFTSPYSGNVGYLLAQYNTGKVQFIGSINGTTIGCLTDDPVSNFYNFTDALGNYLDYGGYLNSSSLSGLETLFLGVDAGGFAMQNELDSMMSDWNSFLSDSISKLSSMSYDDTGNF